MDSRILEVAQRMMKEMYGLNHNYETLTCNIKTSTVEIAMSNGLVELKAKFPRTLVQDNIDLEDNRGN